MFAGVERLAGRWWLILRGGLSSETSSIRTVDPVSLKMLRVFRSCDSICEADTAVEVLLIIAAESE